MNRKVSSVPRHPSGYLLFIYLVLISSLGAAALISLGILVQALRSLA